MAIIMKKASAVGDASVEECALPANDTHVLMVWAGGTNTIITRQQATVEIA